MDLLSGLPARPSTPVPGHWLLAAPPVIHISIFAAASASGDDTNPEDLVTGLRADPIEAAWMAINGSGAVRDALDRCAVVVPGKPKEPKADAEANSKDAAEKSEEERPKEIDLTAEAPKEEAGRRLWVFSAGPVDAPPGLVAVDAPAPIALASTLTCPLHGQSLACLEAGECTPVFAPPAPWRYLEAAAGEKLAWAQGQRLSLLPSPLRIDRSPPVSVRLRPTSGGQLLLTARARAIPQCAPAPGPLGRPEGRSPLVLRPLALPALLVAPFCASAAQDARLSAAFDALGAEWKAGRAEARVAAQARSSAGARPADWGVYFVPLRTNRVARMLPASVAAQWRATPGVLTVWPTHLARPLAPPSGPTLTSSGGGGGGAHVASKPAAGLGDAPALLAAATGLWDFFSSYTEPASDGADEDDGDGDETMEEAPAEPEEGDDESQRVTGSDVDDLFSASPSPDPEPEDEEPFIASAFTSPRGLELEMDDLFGADTPIQPAKEAKEEVVEEDERIQELLPEPEQPGPPSRADTDMHDKNDVTEDDFNFFDSPAKPADSTPAAAAEDTPKPDLPPEPVPEPSPEPVIEIVEPEPSPEPEPETEQEPEASSPLEVVLSPRKRSSIDIVPPAFAPLQLPKRPRMRFAYGLPSPISPAGTTLRVELVERLRARGGKRGYDYAEAWELSSESSASDVDSAFTTGAPPTPSSSDDEGTPPPRAASAAPPAPTHTHEALFDGTLCVGAEWVSLKDDPGLCARLARAWAAAWADLPPDPPEYVPLSPEADAAERAPPDLEAVANAAVRHRFLRPLFAKPTEEGTPTPAPLAKLGVPLSDLTDGDVTRSYALPAPNVHVALGGTVLRLSAAGLRYWRELGLQPAGGPKDVTAYVLCEPGEGERHAAGFLQDVGDVYASHLLGKHTAGAAEGARGGVIAAPPSEMPALISRLGPGAVVYVLAYAPSARSLLPLLGRDNVHVVPVAAARVGNLLSLAFEAYDAQARRVPRVSLRGRQLPPAGPLPYPAFTLAQAPARPQLSMAWPQASADVLARQRGVHAAYAVAGAQCVLAVVDEQGDALDVRVLPFAGPGSVPALHAAMTAAAAQRSAEYRLSVTRVGAMGRAEMAAWHALAPGALLMAEPPAPAPVRPRTPVANIPPSTFADPSAAIVDETLAGAYAPLAARVAVELPGEAGAPGAGEQGAKGEAFYPPASFVLSMANCAGTGATSAVYHVLAPGEMEQDALAARFYELTCLGRRRYALGGMPLHIEAARVGAEAIAVVEGQ